MIWPFLSSSFWTVNAGGAPPEAGAGSRGFRGWCCGSGGSGWRGLGLRFGGRRAERRVVPVAGGVSNERNLRAVDDDAGDVEGLRRDQRPDFNTDIERLRGEERRGAEFRVVGDGKIVRAERAAEEREAQIADFDFATESGGSLLFDLRTETVDRDQERRDDDDQNQDNDNDANNLKCATHGNLRARWESRNARPVECQIIAHPFERRCTAET